MNKAVVFCGIGFCVVALLYGVSTIRGRGGSGALDTAYDEPYRPQGLGHLKTSTSLSGSPMSPVETSTEAS